MFQHVSQVLFQSLLVLEALFSMNTCEGAWYEELTKITALGWRRCSEEKSQDRLFEPQTLYHNASSLGLSLREMGHLLWKPLEAQ